MLFKLRTKYGQRVEAKDSYCNCVFHKILDFLFQLDFWRGPFTKFCSQDQNIYTKHLLTKLKAKNAGLHCKLPVFEDNFSHDSIDA